MRIDIITVLPEMLEGFFNCSIMSRAQKKGIAAGHRRKALLNFTYTTCETIRSTAIGKWMIIRLEDVQEW